MNPEITLVTPERAPLAIFGPRAVEVVSADLDRAGVKVELGAYAEIDEGPPRAILMRPSDRRLEVSRILALPRLRGRTPARHPGRPRRLRHGRPPWARRRRRTASGPRATASTSRSSSAASPPSRPTLPPPTSPPTRAPPSSASRSAPSCAGGCSPAAARATCATTRPGATARARPRTHTLWWPPGKINGRYLTPWLAELDEETVTDHLPHSGGLAVQADLHRDILAS